MTACLPQVSAHLSGASPTDGEAAVESAFTLSRVVDQHGDLAQLVEQRLCKATVVGSNPTFSTKYNAGIAQLVERHVANVIVASSNLAIRSKFWLIA